MVKLADSNHRQDIGIVSSNPTPVTIKASLVKKCNGKQPLVINFTFYEGCLHMIFVRFNAVYPIEKV